MPTPDDSVRPLPEVRDEAPPLRQSAPLNARAGTRSQILLYHDGHTYVAEVLELPGCVGRGSSYAAALRAAEQAMRAAGLLVPTHSSRTSRRALQVNAAQAMHAASSPRKRKPLARQQVGAVKARLIEKFGMLSNRELAARVGLTGRDAPGMLSSAMSGNGTRANRCAVALALGERPSNLWPLRPERQLKDDDAAFMSLSIANPQADAAQLKG